MTYYDQPNRQAVGADKLDAYADREPKSEAGSGSGNDDGTVSQTTTTMTAATGFVVSDATVAEVQEFVTNNPQTLSAVLSAETAGRNRSTLVAWLEAYETS